MQGSPASPSRRRQTRTSAPRSARRSSTASSAQVGTWTSSGRPTAPAMTAAPRAAFPHEAMASGVVDGTSSTARWRARPKRCRALWLPDTLPVSSLAHIPPVWPMASPRAVRWRYGVVANPWPSTSATESSSRRTRSTNRSSDQPAARAAWWDQSRVRNATNGFAPSAGPSSGPGQVAPGGLPSHPILRSGPPVVAPSMSRPTGQSAASTPVRALNSSIMASQIGAMVWMWRQKSCPRRTSKSANSTPCCSTHV